MEIEDMVKINLDKEIFAQVSSLESAIKSCEGLEKHLGVLLRKASLVRSINSSLAIEGNGMNPLQMMDTINGRSVIGPFDEIVEVKNAVSAYGRLSEWKAWNIDDFLEAFDTLTYVEDRISTTSLKTSFPPTYSLKSDLR